METGKEGKSTEYIFQWKIENVSNFWWLVEGEEISSPSFFAEALKNTKWSIRFFPMGNRVKDKISLYLYREKDCSAPDDIIEVSFKLAFLGKDGSLLLEKTPAKYRFSKGNGRGFPKFESPQKVFFTEREQFVLEDTLTIQCTLHKSEETPVKCVHLYGQTVLKVSRKIFVWEICECNTIESDRRYMFKDALFNLEIVLNKDFDGLHLDMISFDDSIKYISFIISVSDSKGKKELWGLKNYFACDLKSGILAPMLLFPKKFIENKSRYLVNDILSFDFDVVFSTAEYFGYGRNPSDLENNIVKKDSCYVGENISQNMPVLINDFKSLYNEGIFSDMEIRTPSRTFPVHKNILSARSPVFRKMFTNDMKENNNGYVVITDIDSNIVYEMLLYIYTGTLGDLKFEIASKLYAAADKYEIMSLKKRCCSFLKNTLCKTGVCDILILADLHQDEDLKNAAQTYLFKHDEFFSSLQWKEFMDSHLKLASDIMYRKVNPGKLCLSNI